jgi:hypothetical protein
MDEQKLRDFILEKSADGTLSCADAHLISEKLGIHLSLIGKACNGGRREDQGNELSARVLLKPSIQNSVVSSQQKTSVRSARFEVRKKILLIL